ncbi:MAG: VOC family protein [Myxococcales bacterium]|nr:VOC family protein [Myxococcales bacterium]
MRLGYTILYVSDVAAAVAFYARAFNLTPRFVHESGTYGELDTGATTLSFARHDLIEGHGFAYQRSEPAGPALGFEIGLVTDDVAQAYARALDAGALPVHPPARKPWGQTVAYVRDLEGFLVELCTPMG